MSYLSNPDLRIRRYSAHLYIRDAAEQLLVHYWERDGSDYHYRAAIKELKKGIEELGFSLVEIQPHEVAEPVALLPVTVDLLDD